MNVSAGVPVNCPGASVGGSRPTNGIPHRLVDPFEVRPDADSMLSNGEHLAQVERHGRTLINGVRRRV